MRSAAQGNTVYGLFRCCKQAMFYGCNRPLISPERRPGGTSSWIQSRRDPIGHVTLCRVSLHHNMIDETFRKIEERIGSAPSMQEETRQELKRLLGTLHEEVHTLSETHPEHSASIAGFADISSHEAVKSQQKPDLLKPALQGLNASVMELENEYPELFQLVNRISMLLSNMGI